MENIIIDSKSKVSVLKEKKPITRDKAIIRLGVIGAGLIWEKVHEPILKEMAGDISIKAIGVASTQKKSKLEKLFPSADLYIGYEELLQRQDLDVVLVLTPLMDNGKVGIAVLNSGKSLLIEKPIAINSKEAQELLAAKATSGKGVFLLENAVYGGPWKKIKEVIESGEIGELVSYERFGHSMFDSEKNHAGGYGHSIWRQEGKFPLGALFDGGIHSIAQNAEVFGQAKTVYASGRSLRSGFGAYDYILMNFSYENGLKGIFSFSSYMPAYSNCFNIRGTKGSISVGPSGFTITIPSKETQEIAIKPVNPNTFMWKHLLASMRNQTEPYFTAVQGVKDVMTLEAVDKSIKEGRIINIGE